MCDEVLYLRCMCQVAQVTEYGHKALGFKRE